MSDKMPTNIHIREFEDDMGIPHTATCSENNPKGKEYTLVHNNTDYHIIPKGENIICQGSMMYNPNSHKIVDLDEYHIIPKADVDGDVMGALRSVNYAIDEMPKNKNGFVNIGYMNIKTLKEIRNALIAQSSEVEYISKDDQEQQVWQAIQDIKIGNKTDDKSIVANLWKNGYAVVKLLETPAENAQPSNQQSAEL
jgi:hypothetical protein